MNKQLEQAIGNQIYVIMGFAGNGVITEYFHAIQLIGEIIKVNDTSFIFSVKNLRFCDGTLSGGPSGDVKPYKIEFAIADIDQFVIGKDDELIEIQMKK